MGKILLYAYTLVFLYDIPKCYGLPVSPKFPLMILWAFCAIAPRLIRGRKILFGMPRSLLLFFLFTFGVSLYQYSLRGSLLSIECLLVYACFVNHFDSRRDEVLPYLKYVVGLLLFSCLWLIGSRVVGEPFSHLRESLYAGHVDRFEAGLFTIIERTGLTFNHFIMGYQIAAGMVLSLFLSFSSKGSARVLWISAVIIFSVGVIYAAQRSVLPAVVLPLLLSSAARRQARLFLGLIFCIISVVFVVKYHPLSDDDAVTIDTRLGDKEDPFARLSWQVAALSVIAQNPLGDILGNLDWERQSQDSGADFSLHEYRPQAVHNSYLGMALLYGWVGGALGGLALWRVCRVMIFPCFHRIRIGAEFDIAREICGLGLLACLVNGLFHNASFFTQEPSSWLLLCVAGAAATMAHRDRAPTANSSAQEEF